MERAARPGRDAQRPLAAPDPSKDPCLLPAGAGYRRLENQLYRVEVHQGGALGQATFKWSRDNGTVVTAIESIKGSVITVHDIGPDDALGFAHGQWVEITDDALELNGLPGQLAQIDTVNAATREITLQGVAPTPLAATPSGVDPARHPKLRRWDQLDQAAAPVCAIGIKTAAGWLPLEDGISVQFSDRPVSHRRLLADPRAHRDGRDRVAALRGAQPQPAAAAPPGDRASLLPPGIDPGAGWRIDKDITDCRKLFPPLTELTAAGVKPALHVVKTNWANDACSSRQICSSETGLSITLDGPPDPASVSNETVIVTMEIPYVSGGRRTPSSGRRSSCAGR